MLKLNYNYLTANYLNQAVETLIFNITDKTYYYPNQLEPAGFFFGFFFTR